MVALRLECVDRNPVNRFNDILHGVALRLECVDRNIYSHLHFRYEPASHSVWSAWIEMDSQLPAAVNLSSHSVWSAWIEILWFPRTRNGLLVALRLECVDRNYNEKRIATAVKLSHSVWSAWIEIRHCKQ